MEDFNDFYRNKVVLVSGHTGFKGSWLSLWLNKMGAKVIGYSIDSLGADTLFERANLADKIVDVRGDVNNFDELFKIFKQHNPEIVFHLAAQPIVRKSYDEPALTFMTNIMGTVNVLECIRKSDSVKSAVMITSDKCYKNKDDSKSYGESDELGGFDPYSASKACAEIVVSSCRDSFFRNSGVNVASVRAGNVIGGGDWAEDRIVPDCMRALLNNEEIIVRNPESVRPWQHVLEPLNGYLLLGMKLFSSADFAGAWNFGPENDNIVTVKALVEKILEKWSSGSWKHSGNGKGVHEMNFLCLNSMKAVSKLGWKPVLTLDETVSMIVEWYKNFRNEDIYELSLNQINNFLKLRGERI
ncbi:CDP-glucose 4,6-dehydratase [archaeon CG07_land_8_20_14_0_80_38_8]|nr:MAG: CDP-glucose 4,6-dehydratase [archaeon CG07_land_8_20_14_0_80_38_8]PIU89594.1 MAG: CDP-glucose 4,6-dehydratase [archaeon CG06_land_8_20_14_3_00_37_11]